MTIATHAYATSTLRTPEPRTAPTGAAPRKPKARSRRTLRPMQPIQHGISVGSVITITRSPVAHAQLHRPVATLPYNAPTAPIVRQPKHAAHWQAKHASAAADAVMPIQGPKPSRRLRTATAAKEFALPEIAQSASQDTLLFDDACAIASADPVQVAAILRDLSPDTLWRDLIVPSRPVPAHQHALQVARLLARSDFDALLAQLPAGTWHGQHREALRIWLTAGAAAHAPETADGQHDAARLAAAAAVHALHMLRDNPTATASALCQSLRNAGLLAPYFNWKHGFSSPEDVRLAQKMMLTYGKDMRRAYRLATSWRARCHPRRLFGRKTSAVAAMHNHMTGLRRDLPHKERERLDLALKQAAGALFASEQHEAILAALFRSAAPEHKLEVVRQIVVLRHLHAHTQANQQQGVETQRPFFAPLHLTAQDMAHATLMEIARLSPELGRNDPQLLRELQQEARVMLTQGSQAQWQPPTTQHLLAWHAQWLTALGNAGLDAADDTPLCEALIRLRTHLDDAAGTEADDPQLSEMTPEGFNRDLNGMYTRMHNHSAGFHSGSNLGIAARVVLYFVPGVGLRPKVKQITGKDATIAVGQSLSGSYLAIGRQWRLEGGVGADAVFGVDALPMQAGFSVGLDTGYKHLRGEGLMIRANKLVDPGSGAVIKWNPEGQPAEQGVETNRWTINKVSAFLCGRCRLADGKFHVPTAPAALWEDFAAVFFDSPNLQLSIYRETKMATSASLSAQVAVRAGSMAAGPQLAATARLEASREQRSQRERSTRNAALIGEQQTRGALTLEGTAGVALPAVNPSPGLHKMTAPPVNGLQLHGVFADRRRNVQYRLQHVDGKIDGASFRYEIVSTLPQLRALLQRDADVWNDMAGGTDRLEYFYEEHRRHYRHLPNTVFYVICDLRRPAAKRLDAIASRLVLLDAQLATATGAARARLAAQAYPLQQQRQRILQDRANWTPYAIDLRQNVTGSRQFGPHLGVVAQHTEGVSETLMLMRLSALPEQRHSARVNFERELARA